MPDLVATAPRGAEEPPDPTAYYTGDMARAFNAANPKLWPRYETVYGELLVSPAPRDMHQDVAFELAFRLRLYLDRFPVGRVKMSPADVSFGRDDVTVQPDVFVLPMSSARALRASQRWTDARDLMLVCEVISPSTQRYDRFTKRKLYQDAGIPLYWIVDPGRGHAEVATPDGGLPRVERAQLVWHPDGAAEPLVLSLAELFAVGE